MRPVDFRRDPHLRTSAYHLATWSLAAFVLELRMSAADAAGDATLVSTAIVLAGASLLSSTTHARRVAKMAGPPAAPLFAAAGQMWAAILVVLVLASVVLAQSSRTDLVFSLWMFGVGAGFALWGTTIGFAWYTGVGLFLAAIGAMDAAACVTSGPAPFARALMLGMVIPALALETNRRFLWMRPGR